MTRREWLKLTTAAGGAALLPNVTGVLARAGASPQGAPASGRERLLADFGWRFHLGHADDVAKDFGFGRGGAFAKSGSLIGGRGSITQAAFDDKAWTAVDLPHDWAIDLPFVEDRGLNGHGAKPLGRAYPETSIGWYRRTFDMPASDAGRRIALEFDGVFRDAIVVLNGHFVGRNLSGYAPFRFDVTDSRHLTAAGTRCVLRVDATEYEGWFYEGAGIYRHVWLEKTAPLHVAHSGTFVTSEVSGNDGDGEHRDGDPERCGCRGALRAGLDDCRPQRQDGRDANVRAALHRGLEPGRPSSSARPSSARRSGRSRRLSSTKFARRYAVEQIRRVRRVPSSTSTRHCLAFARSTSTPTRASS